MKTILLTASITLLGTASTQAAIFVSEVHSNGSGGVNGYAADFFELTNNGPAAVTITGWKMDDNSNAFGSSVALRGATSIAAGQSIVFIEGDATGSNDAALATNFRSSWFGTNVPAGFTSAGYGGSGVGLSTSGDAVNIFDATGARITGIAFPAAIPATTFDNAAAAGSTTLPLPIVSTGSVVGVNGAFASVFTPNEFGSPGVVPEPTTAAVIAGLAGLITRRQRR